MDPTLPTLVPVWFAAGLVWWTLLEYLLHRFAFHGGRAWIGSRHGAHHDNVRDRDLSLASPPAVALGVGLHALALVPTLGPLPGGTVLAGVVTGYAVYEWVHLAIHRPRPRGRLLRRLRRHHLLHHGAQPDARFGVTTTFWDRLFGTMPGPSVDRCGRGTGRSMDVRFGRKRKTRSGFAALRAPSPALPGLSRRQVRVIRAVAEALLADGSGPPPRSRLESTVREVGAFTVRAGSQTRLGFRAALVAIQWSPLLYLRKPRRFASATLAERIACFERLEGGRLAILAVVLKLSLCLAYFELPDALAETGYNGPGPPRSTWRPPRTSAATLPEGRRP